jgi:hypothetical protein
VGAEARPEEEKYGGATLAHERVRLASGGKAVTAAARTLPAAGSGLGVRGPARRGLGSQSAAGGFSGPLRGYCAAVRGSAAPCTARHHCL